MKSAALPSPPSYTPSPTHTHTSLPYHVPLPPRKALNPKPPTVLPPPTCPCVHTLLPFSLPLPLPLPLHGLHGRMSLAQPRHDVPEHVRLQQLRHAGTGARLGVQQRQAEGRFLGLVVGEQGGDDAFVQVQQHLGGGGGGRIWW